jgi:hypothetical protein
MYFLSSNQTERDDVRFRSLLMNRGPDCTFASWRYFSIALSAGSGSGTIRSFWPCRSPGRSRCMDRYPQRREPRARSSAGRCRKTVRQWRYLGMLPRRPPGADAWPPVVRSLALQPGQGKERPGVASEHFNHLRSASLLSKRDAVLNSLTKANAVTRMMIKAWRFQWF